MYQIQDFCDIHISEIIRLSDRTHLQYHEYSSISDDKLKSFTKNKLIRILNNNSSISYIVTIENRLVGFISVIKEEFDSEIFEFDCYRVTELIIFSKLFSEIKQITKLLIEEVEKSIEKINTKYYIALGLNNNYPQMDFLFNSLIYNNFYYIHTLVTFSSSRQKFETFNYYSNDNLTIRKVALEDATQVSSLAYKSFSLSRFHMDPFLDNEKSSILLKTSANNSILHGFVDVMFIAEIEEKIVGYYSAKKKSIVEFGFDIGEATISAVDKEYRGHGIFNKLDSHLLNWFSENTEIAEMGTYLSNYPIHKTWINKGLRMVRGTHQFSKFVNTNKDE